MNGRVLRENFFNQVICGFLDSLTTPAHVKNNLRIAVEHRNNKDLKYLKTYGFYLRNLKRFRFSLFDSEILYKFATSK